MKRLLIITLSVPSWLTGDLGAISREPQEAAVEAIRALGSVFRCTANDEFEMAQPPIVDPLGQTHIRLQQLYCGLRVEGSQMIVHLQRGHVIGVNGHFFPDLNLDVTPTLSAETATAMARLALPSNEVTEVSRPKLLVNALAENGPRLAWSQQVSFDGDDGLLQKDLIFADAHTGDLLARHSLIWTAKVRKVYTANNSYNLPGSLIRSDT